MPDSKLDVEEVRRRLLEYAFLFDDPEAYRAGIEDALEEASYLMGEESDTETEQSK